MSQEQELSTKENQTPDSTKIAQSLKKIQKDAHTASPINSIREITSSTRLYISNVSYKTTEDDLWNLFRDFGVTYILIPTQTIRLSFKYHQKSLGIAYIDFKDEECALQAKDELNGTLIDGRAINIKQFSPYKPNKTFKRRSCNNSNSSKAFKEVESGVTKEIDQTKTPLPEESSLPEPKAPELYSEDEVKVDEIIQSGNSLNSETNVVTKEYSKDTVYIARLHQRITDGDLRAYFHLYAPTAVYIFKSYRRPRRIKFGRKYVSALVTLSAEEGLKNALQDLKSTKLCGKFIKLDVAYKDKVEEVTRAARALEKKNQEIDEHFEQAATASVGYQLSSNMIPESQTLADTEQEQVVGNTNADHEV